MNASHIATSATDASPEHREEIVARLERLRLGNRLAFDFRLEFQARRARPRRPAHQRAAAA